MATTPGTPSPAAAIARAITAAAPVLITADPRVAYAARADGLPLLDSNPGAAFKIFLDFDGFTGVDVSHAAMSLDGDPATFNADEQAAIAGGWRQIATFLAPFDVSVTTVQPTIDETFSWLLVGNGVADRNSVGTVHAAGAANYQPTAFSPTADLTGRITGLLHQIGHTFGLSHQSEFDAAGGLSREYARAADPLHAPVMGRDDDGTVPAWINGHSLTSGPAAMQDDVAVILNTVRAAPGGTASGYRADEIAGVMPLPLATDVTGILETLGDVDAFSLTVAESGAYDLSAVRDGLSSVDLKLEVYDAAGTLLGAADGETNDQSFRLDLAAGTYTVLVKSHGNYGDIGQYRVRAARVDVRSRWTFDADAGATTAGTGRTAADGSVNGATWTADGHNGTGGLAFDGVDDVVTIGAAASLSGLADFTIDAWIKTTDADGGTIVQQRDAAGLSGYVVGVNADGTIRFSLLSADSGQFDFSTTSVVNDGLWHRVVARRAGVQGRIYVDGSLAATASGAAVALDGAGVVTVGGDPTGGHGYLVGSIDDVRIDDVAAAGYEGLGATTLTATRGGVDAATNRPTIDLAWTAVADAAGYAILRSFDGATYAPLASVDASVLHHVDVVANGARRYFYQVVAIRADGVGGSISAAAHAVSVPQAIANGRVSATASGILVLDWAGGDSHGETAYRIERSTDGTTFVTLTDAHPANTPSYTAAGLTGATQYWFRLTPLDGAAAGAAVVLTGMTRDPLPQVAGLRIESRDRTSMSIAWADVAGETGYRVERSPDGFAWTAVTTLGADATSYLDASLSPRTEYHFRVVAFDATSEAVPSAKVFALTDGDSTLPAGWSATDIGAVGAAGGSGYAGSLEEVGSGAWTSLSAGADVGGTADAFRFVYRTLDGDGQLIARVDGVENTNGRARAGVMIREGLSADARHAFMSITAGDGAEFAARKTAGGATTRTATAGLAVPQWVKIVRRGTTLTGYSSVDGVTWTLRGTTTMTSLAGTVSIGLANVSADDAAFSTATFDRISMPDDIIDPTVQPVRIGSGTVQRSVVRNVTLTFDEPVTLAANAATVRRSGGGTDVATSFTNPSGDGKTFIVTFAGTGTASGSLDDGVYVLTLHSGRIADASGNAMARDATTTFHRLFGDVTGDRAVSNVDSARFRRASGTVAGDAAYDAAFDYDNNGQIGNTDLAQFRRREGTRVPSTQLAGTVVGTAGSFNNNGNTAAKAFDGSFATFFDSPSANGGWAGLDFGAARVIDEIRYAPRGNYPGRMVGGAFEGANNANFSDAVLLASITTAPAPNVFTSVAVTNTGTFRYVRYRAPLNSYANVSELQFFGLAAESAGEPTTADPAPSPAGIPVTNVAAANPIAVLTAVTGTGVIAGQAVHFDALASTLNAGGVTAARFEWDFGEPTSAFNKLVGYNVAHVYEKTGTYTVTLRVINEAGKSATATTKVSVTADTRAAIYVSAAGDDANGGTSAGAPVRTIGRAAALLGQGDRVSILFRRGDTFDVAGALSVWGDDVTIGAYGTGDRPTLRYTGPRTVGGTILIAQPDASDLVIRDLTFDSIYDADTEQAGMPFGVMIKGRNVTVRDNVFRNVGYANNVAGSAVGTLLQGNSAPLETGLRAYFAWVEGTDTVILNNAVANSTREHVIRASGFNRMLVHANDFTNLDRRAVDPGDFDKNSVTVQKGSYAYVSGNRLGAIASFGPLGTTETISQKDTRTTFGVFEGNHLTHGSLKVQHGAEHIMVRNNVFDVDNDAHIDVQGFNASFGRGVVDLSILNNTGINDGTRGNFLRTYAPVDGIRLLNNLYVAPSLMTGAYDTAPVLVYDTTLRNFTAIDSNNWGLPTASNWAQGGANWVGVVSESASYQTPAEWNALAGVGTDLFVRVTLGPDFKPIGEQSVVNAGSAIGGVFVDYLGNYRDPTKWAIGAA